MLAVVGVALYLRRRSRQSAATSQDFKFTGGGASFDGTPSTSLLFGSTSASSSSAGTGPAASLPTAEGDDDGMPSWNDAGLQQHAKQYNHREISTHESL